MAETRRLLAVFLIGLLVGVAATTAVSLGFQQSLSVSVPSATVSDDCESADPQTGWAAQIPNRGHQTVLLNRSISGPVANSSLDGEMDFRLTIMTEDAQTGCHYDAAVTLPDTFDSLTVVHDGREVFRLQSAGTSSTRFWRLNESSS